MGDTLGGRWFTSVNQLMRLLFRAHRNLPRSLRVWAVVPLTLAWVIFEGLVFTLPPGPLCDEGMVLFMEGGCDYGESNVFFHCKLGLLLALNAILIVAWRSNVRNVLGFVPHLLVLLYITVTNLSGYCDTYYSHPNGSLGQMTLEAIAFALAGMSVLHLPTPRKAAHLLVIVVAWNALHVLVFYLGLQFTNHWTWEHTWFIFAVLLVVAALLTAMAARSGAVRAIAPPNSA
jgi:hypothetical protein